MNYHDLVVEHGLTSNISDASTVSYGPWSLGLAAPVLLVAKLAKASKMVLPSSNPWHRPRNRQNSGPKPV